MNLDDIKKIREDNKMTQVDVCKAVGVSLAAYRNWELGAGKPTPENMLKLKAALGIK